MRRTRVHGEGGALAPGFLMLAIAAIVGLLFFLQIGHANVLATESRTAADAAALAGAEYLRYRVSAASVLVGSRLDESGACAHAEEYANRNRATVISCTVEDATHRLQYAVEVDVRGLEGPTTGPSDSLPTLRPEHKSRVEVALRLAPPGAGDPTNSQGLHLGWPIVGGPPVVAPEGGSPEWDERMTSATIADLLPRRPGGPPIISPGGWVRPVPGAMTSPFGPRWGGFHRGVDLGGPTGQEVVASRAGNVSHVTTGCNAQSSWGCGGGFGNYVVVSHGNARTYYAHLSAVGVANGQAVEAGEVIGLVGNSGNSYGSHLHFEVHVGGVPDDPCRYITC